MLRKAEVSEIFGHEGKLSLLFPSSPGTRTRAAAMVARYGRHGRNERTSLRSMRHDVSWSRLSEQTLRVDKWSLCRV